MTYSRPCGRISRNWDLFSARAYRFCAAVREAHAKQKAYTSSFGCGSVCPWQSCGHCDGMCGTCPSSTTGFPASLHGWIHLLCQPALGHFHLPSLSPLAALRAREKDPGNVLKYLFPQTAMFAAAVWSYLIKQNTNSETCSAHFLPLTGE